MESYATLVEPQRFDSDVCWLEYQAIANPNVCKAIAVFNQSRGSRLESHLIEQARDSFSKRWGVTISHVVVPDQIHGSSVFYVDSDHLSRNLRCDGLVTQSQGVALGVTVADCIPLIAHDDQGRIAGIAHCGWRGIAAGIVERFVEAFTQRGFNQSDLLFLIGASIGVCCYEVGEDLLTSFGEEEVDLVCIKKDGKRFMDLKSMVALRLLRNGAKRDRIWLDPTCTSCSSSWLPSYRASKGSCGRMLALVALKPK